MSIEKLVINMVRIHMLKQVAVTFLVISLVAIVYSVGMNHTLFEGYKLSALTLYVLTQLKVLYNVYRVGRGRDNDENRTASK